ncbi:unnamed protein product [Boreogadus saida]
MPVTSHTGTPTRPAEILSLAEDNRKDDLWLEIDQSVGVYLDRPAGSLSFYRVSPGGGGSSDTLTHLHTFWSSFTQEDLLPGVGFWRKQTSETCGSKAKKTADGEEKEVQTESSGEETESSEEEEEMVDCVTDSQPLTDSPLASASQLDGMYSVHSIQVFLERTKNMKNVHVGKTANLPSGITETLHMPKLILVVTDATGASVAYWSHGLSRKGRGFATLVGSWGWGRAAGGRGAPPLLVPAAGVAVDGPDVRGRRRTGSPNGAPTAPPTTDQVGAPKEVVPDHTPRAPADSGVWQTRAFAEDSGGSRGWDRFGAPLGH